MAAEPSRLETLRRRVQQDPASFAFAALAEEYRRCGQLDDAVATCRKGLDLHPSYTAGRVTLARALTAQGDLDEARGEFEEVLKAAPENLAARRGLAEVQRETGDLAGALATFRLAVALAPQDPELAQSVASLEFDLAAAAPATPHGTSAPTGDTPPREPSFELQVVGSEPFPADDDLMISTGETVPSTGDGVEPGAFLSVVPDFEAAVPDAGKAPGTQAWLDAWDFEPPVGAVEDAKLPEAAGRADGEDEGAPGGDPAGVIDVAVACPQSAVPEDVPEVRADTGPGDVAPAEPLFAEQASSLALIETEAASPAADDASSLPLIDAQATPPPDEFDLDLPLRPDAASDQEPDGRGFGLGLDAPAAEILILPDPPVPDDDPADPRLDALETFLEAVVRARARG